MELAFAKSFVYLHHKSDAPLDVIRPSDDKQSLTVLVDTSDNRDTSFNVDYCVDIHEEQDHSRVTSHFKHATSQVLQGIHASVFSMSAGRCTYDRNRVATEILDQLERSWSKQRDQYKVSYVFIGITDARCLDISNGATIDGETLQKQGLDRFYEKVNDCSSIKELVIRGCSRPSLMSIRVEKSGAHPTCAFLSLVDFGPADFTPNPLVELQSPTSVNVLSKSFEVFMQVVRYSAQSTFNGYLPTDNSMLTRLTAGAIGQNCATTFILHVEANKKEELSEIVQALKFAETARKIRCHLAPVKVDLRLPYYENKYRHQCDIIEEKEAHVRGLENEWETRLNEANNKLQEEQAEKERVLNRCQQLENELNATANDLRQQYEETNAKMHHEMELLKKQETLQLTRTEKNSVEAQVLLHKANVQIAMMEDEKEMAAESQQVLMKMLNHAKAETQRILALNEQLQLAIHNQEQTAKETTKSLQRKLEISEANFKIVMDKYTSTKAKMKVENNEEVIKLRKILYTLEEKYVGLKKAHKALETAHTELKEGHSVLEEKRAELKQDYKTLGEKYVELKQTHKTLETTHAELKQDHNVLKNKHAELKQTHKALEDKYTELDQDHKTLETTHAELKQDHNVLKNKHAELKQTHKAAETTHKQLEKDLETTRTQLNTALTMAEQTQKQLDTETRTSEEETVTLRKNLRKLESENQQLQSQVEQLTKQLENTKLNRTSKAKSKKNSEVEEEVDDNDDEEKEEGTPINETATSKKKPTKTSKKSKAAVTRTESVAMDVDDNDDNDNDNALTKATSNIAPSENNHEQTIETSIAPLASSTKATGTTKRSKQNSQASSKVSDDTSAALSNSTIVNAATSILARPPLHQVASLNVDDNKINKAGTTSIGDINKKRRKLMSQRSTTDVNLDAKPVNIGLRGGLRIGFARSGRSDSSNN